MKRDLPHPVFPEPEDLNVAAWRYTPLAQLLSVMILRQIALIRIDLLGDPFEGSITAEIKDQDVGMAAHLAETTRFGGPEAKTLAQPLRTEQIVEGIRRRRISILRGTHASCWRMGKESEGMWRLFCGLKGGVAMRTTCAKLKASITDDATRLAKITYLDYAAGRMPADNLLYPIMFKRDGFRDENEVRLIRYLDVDTLRVLEDPEQKGEPAVRMMRWDPGATIDQLVVSPYAEQWYFDTVFATVEKLAPSLSSRVVWSSLRGQPVH